MLPYSRAPFACLLAMLLALAGTAARGAFSGLGVIPTADVVGAGQYSLEFEIGGGLTGLTCDARSLLMQFGANDGFEAGVDFDLCDDTEPFAVLNAKYVFAGTAADGHALAAGIANVGADEVNPYLAATGRLPAVAPACRRLAWQRYPALVHRR